MFQCVSFGAPVPPPGRLEQELRGSQGCKSLHHVKSASGQPETGAGVRFRCHYDPRGLCQLGDGCKGPDTHERCHYRVPSSGRRGGLGPGLRQAGKGLS